MTKYSPAKWRPISRNFSNRKRTRTRGIVLHVDAGDNASLFNYFNTTSTPASCHIHVAKNGSMEQYVDLDKISWTSGEGNATTIGVETQGLGSEAWTAQQITSLAKLVRWAAFKYDFPLRRMKSSRANSKGVGTHRLGVNGNFPTTGVQRGRQQRAKKGLGELWSSTVKTCPGDKRQAQWPDVVRLAQTHEVTKKTLGRKGAACYKARKVGGKNITRILPVGRNVRIVRKRGAWGRTKKGDWIKMSKIKGV